MKKRFLFGLLITFMLIAVLFSSCSGFLVGCPWCGLWPIGGLVFLAPSADNVPPAQLKIDRVEGNNLYGFYVYFGEEYPIENATFDNANNVNFEIQVNEQVFSFTGNFDGASVAGNWAE